MQVGRLKGAMWRLWPRIQATSACRSRASTFVHTRRLSSDIPTRMCRPMAGSTASISTPLPSSFSPPWAASTLPSRRWSRPGAFGKCRWPICAHTGSQRGAGRWYPKHVGFLGAAAPAVPGLKNAHFAGKAGVVFTAQFGTQGLEEAASLFRKMRDFFIDRFGIKDADKVLLSWQIECLTDVDHPAPRFSARISAGRPPAEPVTVIEPLPLQQKKEPAVTQLPDPAFAAREAIGLWDGADHQVSASAVRSAPITAAPRWRR